MTPLELADKRALNFFGVVVVIAVGVPNLVYLLGGLFPAHDAFYFRFPGVLSSGPLGTPTPWDYLQALLGLVLSLGPLVTNLTGKTRKERVVRAYRWSFGLVAYVFLSSAVPLVVAGLNDWDAFVRRVSDRSDILFLLALRLGILGLLVRDFFKIKEHADLLTALESNTP